MTSLFAHTQLANIHRDVVRNIVSLRESQDLFDDLTDDPAEWLLAQNVEDEVKPPLYASRTPLIDRPFEDAQWFNAIVWPFKHWQTSRFSDGSLGVWYGSESDETTVYGSAYRAFQSTARLPVDLQAGGRADRGGKAARCSVDCVECSRPLTFCPLTPSPPPHHKPRKPRPQPLYLPGG